MPPLRQARTLGKGVPRCQQLWRQVRGQELLRRRRQRGLLQRHGCRGRECRRGGELREVAQQLAQQGEQQPRR
eukprot:3346039-Alexandrium_andersonii.AAC.1